jgi:hypothetical protein
MRTTSLLLLAACAGDGTPTEKDNVADTVGDTDVDTDTDVDADTDVDTDTDADTDPGTDSGMDTATTTDTGPVDTTPADLADCVVVIDTDAANDGSIDVTTTITYDAMGLEVAISVDDADPATAAEITITRNTDGDEVDRAIDQTGDGVVDDRVLLTWTTDRQLDSYCYDLGDDGTCDFAERFGYDAYGHRTTYEQDGDGNGTYESTCTYTYDTSDRRTSYDCGGPLNQSAIYTYTGVTFWDYLWDLDLGRNGTIDQHWDEQYDADGRLIYEGADTNNNGVWDTELWNTWNPDGSLSLVEGEIRSPASSFRLEHDYDVEGYLLQKRFGIDVTGDGIPDNLDVDDFVWTCP